MKHAFYLSGAWNIGEFRRRLPVAQQGDWATAPLPGPHVTGAGIAGGSSLVIFRASPHEYLSQPQAFAVWKNFSYNMIILLAGLQAIPADLYEAARIDGASVPRQFWHINLPMLKPAVPIVTILTVAGYFQLFAEPYVTT